MRSFGIAVVAAALVPALLTAQTDSSRMRDSSRRAGRQQQTSSGSIANSSMRPNARLSHDQVTQLQTALQNVGCDPGSVDGVMGTHTRSAMSCAKQKNNITSGDPEALYESLNLNFSASDTGVVNGRRSRGGRNSNASTTGNSGTITNGTTGATGKAHGTRTHRMRGDSTHRTTKTRPDSARRP